MWGSANNDFFFSGAAKPKADLNEETNQKINECIKNLEKAKQEITTNTEQCILKINDDFEYLIASITNRKAEILEKLNNLRQTKMGKIDTELEFLRGALDSKTTKPSHRELSRLNSAYQSHQNEIFYTNQYAKKRFLSVISEYGDISLPLPAPSLLFVRNNARNFDIEFKWNLRSNGSNQSADCNLTQIRVHWQQIDDAHDSKEQNDDDINNNNLNITTMEIMNIDGHLYHHRITVDGDGTYSFRLQYFESNLQVWSKLSKMVKVDVSRISEVMVVIDVWDKEYILTHVDAQSGHLMVTGNGSKKGKYARMCCGAKGYNEGVYEWKIECVQYDGSAQSGDASHAIGVFTNKEIAAKGANWVNDKRIRFAYYWNSYRRFVYGSCDGEYVLEQNVNDGWKTGDVITVLLDCKQWTIQFAKNGKAVNAKPIKIQKDEMYYPMMVMRSHNDIYKILPYD